MKRSVDHLPDCTRRLIEDIVSIVLNCCEPEKIILFGSHATEKWRGDIKKAQLSGAWYVPEFDILVISKAGDHVSETFLGNSIDTNINFRDSCFVSILTQDILYVNKSLAEGQHFFVDVIINGLLLYDSSGVEFERIGLVRWDSTIAVAETDRKVWLGDAVDFLQVGKHLLKKGNLRLALFLLHQAAECAYNALLLVHRGFKRKTHNLKALYKQTKSMSERVAGIFPTDLLTERQLFKLLCQSYIDARYDKEFEIQLCNVDRLTEKLDQLIESATEICDFRIKQYELASMNFRDTDVVNGN